MIGAYRFDMCGTPRIATGGILDGGCADVQLENTLFAPRGRGCVPD